MYYNYSDHSTDMNKDVLDFVNEFNKYYSVNTYYHINESSSKQILWYKVYKCRFCKKTAPEVSFKREAHALPHLIGNNLLFTHIECDDCNGKFGRVLETHFANFMHLNHTLTGVKGKKGYPEFKIDNANITTTGSFINWQDLPNENFNYDLTAGILTITQKMHSYIPIAVYKCLVKMALTIMPESELINFEKTLEWINEDDHKDSKFHFEHLWLLHGSVSTLERFQDISAIILKRHETTHTDNPYMIFRLTYACFMFLVPIPLGTLDKTISSLIMPYVPNVFDLEHGFGKMELNAMNCYPTELIKGTEMTIKITDLDGTSTIETTTE